VHDNPDYLWFVEHTARELDIACLIKYLMQKQHGKEIQIVSLPYSGYFEIFNINPEIIMVPYCYSFSSFSHILPHYRKIKLLNLAYEQIFQNINLDLKSPKDDFTKKYVIHHAWSEDFKKYQQNFGVNPKNIFVNGNLSYGLYKKPYMNFFMKKNEISKKFGLNPDHTWILIPENYGAAFYTESIIQEKISNGININDVIDYKNFAQESLKILIKWCIKACDDKSVEIIFRPRPATPTSKMVEYFKSESSILPKNLHITKDYSVREWILASDVVMSSYSTTLIEAAVAEKPIYMLAPIVFPPYLHADWYNLVPQVTCYHEFLEIIRAFSPDSCLKLKQWTESKYLKNGDPVQGIVRLLLKIPDIEIWASDNPELKKTIPENEGNILSNIVKTIGVSFRKPKMEDYENDFFTPQDVLRKKMEWERILNNII